ncbi:ethylene-insensitive protein 2.2 [Malania oleifera]|uniref:ethylene-insensitive protein 2.2 n=1 Tax=Malania oleifera TaxID=397392 RepID=UPI0025AE4CB8|nr:ethylene-insensitive protein 2.2 [Malania oleifera]
MEGEIWSSNHLPGVLQRLLPASVPVLLIAIGYVDPGKWAAAVDGGAHFGFDLVVLVLFFNFAAILCQYLSAYIGVVTGRDLVQICSNEYDKSTCIFLGVQVELSVIALDLTMVLGTALGLNLIFGIDLLACVFLTGVDAILFPIFAAFLEKWTAKFLGISMAGFTMLSYVLGMLIGQPEMQLSMNGMLTMLSGESAFILMSLLGASIMPHNFYLHSYIVQLHEGLPNISKETLSHDHFFAIVCVFSGIFLVNYALIHSAANVFYSAGLGLLTFQDALSLMDQVFRSPIAHFACVLVLLFCNQITASTWNLIGRVVLHDFFRTDIPIWLHRATIRAVAIFPALYCVWNSGAEGIYHLLIFTQVMVALLLPSSVIPLFRVASSSSVMGMHKISPFVEFLALITFIGMVGLKIIFVVEMVFGNSDWVGNLRWTMGNNTYVPYIALLVVACASFCLMLWLAATPLKSASARIDAQQRNWDVQNVLSEPLLEREVNDLHESKYHEQEPFRLQEPSLGVNSLGSQSDVSIADVDVDLPETILDEEPHLTTIEENSSNPTFSVPLRSHPKELAATVELAPVSTIVKEVSDGDLLDSSNLKNESIYPVEKTVGIERDLQTVKYDDEGDSWEPEEPSKGVPESGQSLPSEGLGSFRSLSGKSDDGGSGAGSLSRLALGRAARRQFAAVLDEFWGQLYDFHGQATQEAKAKKLDVLLGVDSKPALKVDTAGKDLPGCFPSVGGRGSDSIINRSLFDSSGQQRVQNTIEPSYGVQRGSSSMWSNHMQLLDAYVQNSSRNAFDSGEKRYSSLHLPPSSDGWDYQPATVHGYQIASYLNRIAKDKYSVNGQIESPPPKSTSLGPPNYRGSLAAYAMGQKLQTSLSSVQSSSLQNVVNSPLQSESSYYDVGSSVPLESLVSPINSKKYHSSPDISGLSVPYRDLYMPDRNAQWESSIGYGSSVDRTGYGQSLYSGAGSRAGTLTFDEPSPKVYSDLFSLQLGSSLDAGSLWTRQPFEQFGVGNKTRRMGVDVVESQLGSAVHKSTSIVDLEAKLLQSFRYCILKLLKLEGSDWLFRQNDGADEDLIDRVAARERFLYEAEIREMSQAVQMGESLYLSSERKPNSSLKNDETSFTKFLVSSIPHCGEGCIWRMDLIISFGVWCIHRILELSLMESRPELWGKYTYVLNRLQGIIDLAFSKPRSPRSPCFCLQIPVAHQQRSSPPISNGILPPAVRSGRGKCTTASTLLDIIKDVEIAISCRKGRQGTAAGDVAFPKGKENLASVLKRYKRRLSPKQVGTHEGGTMSRKVPTSAPLGS